MLDRPKDPIISFRNVVWKKSTKKDELNPQGHDRIVLYINPDQIAAMIECLNAQLQAPRGATLDLHVQKRMNTQRGNIFDSAYCFIKEVQEPQAQYGGGAPAPVNRFVPKGTPTAQTLDRTAKVHRALEE